NILEEASVTGSPARRRRQHRSVPLDGGRLHDRLFDDVSDVRREELGRKIVGAFEHEIEGAHDLDGVDGRKAHWKRFDPERGGDPHESRRTDLHLLGADVLFGKEDLTMKVREVYRIFVDEAYRSHPCPRQRDRSGTSEAPHANDENASHSKYSAR